MILRPYRRADAADLGAILHKAVHTIGARDYSPAQLDAWSPAPIAAERFHARVSDGRMVTVAVSDEDVPVAFIELEADGHIDCFYCHPDFAGSSVGRALFRHAKSQAIAAGVTRLTVEASEAARRFFLREDFAVIARRAFELRGVMIHNYSMEKQLEELAGAQEAMRQYCDASLARVVCTLCSMLRRAILVLATIWLSGCATRASDDVSLGVCRPVVE